MGVGSLETLLQLKHNLQVWLMSYTDEDGTLKHLFPTELQVSKNQSDGQYFTNFFN